VCVLRLPDAWNRQGEAWAAEAVMLAILEGGVLFTKAEARLGVVRTTSGEGHGGVYNGA